MTTQTVTLPRELLEQVLSCEPTGYEKMYQLKKQLQSALQRTNFIGSDLSQQDHPEQHLDMVPIAYAVYDIKHGGSCSLHWPSQHSEYGDADHYKVVPLYAAHGIGATNG